MTDKIEVGANASGEDGINRLVTALDRLDASLGKLAANNDSLFRLQRQMAAMQASVTTGFTEMRVMVETGGERVRVARKKSEDQLAADIEKARDRQLNADRVFLRAHEASADRQLGVDATFNQAIAKLDQVRVAQRALDHDRELQIEQRWVALLEAGREKELSLEASFNQAAAKVEQQRVAQRVLDHDREQQIEQKWLAQLAADHERELELEASFNRARAREDEKRLATARSTAEQQRRLNTNFQTAPLSSQVSTAERAQVYSSLGGNAAERYGSSAAGADLAALRRQLDSMPESARRSGAGLSAHNDIMREGHSLARGLAGSLGGLWLTYGSLVPLVAGAAIAASLKGIVTAGKDVEYQLKFVEALGGGQANLDSFLRITDQTVVSIKEAAEGMRALAQNGLNAQQSLIALPDVLNLAVIGEMSVSNAALSATGVMSAFNLQLSDLGMIGDIFARAAASSNTSVAAMTESMKQAATVASIYHVGIDETAAALGTLAKVNITGTAAGTALTNVLTGLYAPTEKAKKALKELGVSTDDGMGGMKNSTVLLGELRDSLSKFNDSAKTNFLNDIFTARGTKGASTIMSNWDEYIKKIEEAQNATGFMGQAVAKLEDSTSGALKRLSNNVQASLVEAFTNASPPLQAVLSQLATLARQEDTVKVLTSMADAVVRLTVFMVDHAQAIALVAASLITLRVLASVNLMWREYQVATAAAAVSTVAAATATDVAAAATVRAAGAARLFQASLGWVGLALTAVVVAYELFLDTTTEFEKANQKIQNTINTNIEYLERETKALHERNKAYNPDTGRFDRKDADIEPTNSAAKLVEKKQDEVDRLQRQLDKMQGGNVQAQLMVISQLDKAKEQLASAKTDQWKETALAENLAVERSVERVKREKAGLLDQIDLLAKKGELQRTSNGELVTAETQTSARAREIASSAVALADKLKANKITLVEAKADLIQLTQMYNGALQGRAPKFDNDAFRATLEAEKLKLQLAQMDSRTNIASAKSANGRGELGDLQLINKELSEKLSLNQKAVEVAKRQWELADAANKLAKREAYEGEGKKAEKQAVGDTLAAEDARKNLLARMKQQEMAFEAKTLADKGQLVDAYNKQYEADYSLVIARVQKDIADSDNATYRDGLQKYLTFLDSLKKAGQEDARGKELKNKFGATFSDLQNKIQDLSNNSGAGAGLSSIFDNASRAAQEYAGALPDLIRQQRDLQNLADRTKNPETKAAANAELRQIQAQAERMRNIWVDVSQQIGKSLTDAFGQGGKAMGDTLVGLTQFDARQKQIKDNFDKSDGGTEAKKKMAGDMASAQVKAYGDMSSAAKGFFNEQSVGYKVMATAEKAFRIAELAMTFETMTAKLFATTTVTAAKVTASTLEAGAAVATVPIVVAAEGAKSSAYGVTALAAALALPFPANIPAFAIVAGMLAMIGVAVAGSGGSGSVPLSQQRDEQNGTGSVMGDSKAKSDSVAKALAMIEKNTYQDLAISNSMLTALQNIEAGIAGLGNLVSQNLGQGTSFGDMKGSNNALGGSAGAMVGSGAAAGAYLGSAFGPVGTAVGAVAGAILGALSRIKVDVQDQGLAFKSQSLGTTVTKGADGSSYSDVNTKKSFLGVTYSNSNERLKNPLSADVLQQFTLVVSNMRTGILAAADAVGAGGDAFVAKLDALAVTIPDITTKGKTGEEIQKALETAFSKLGDDLAKGSLGGLEQFQKAGEGYLETLMRIAAGYQAIDAVFQSIGKSFALVGTDSIAARERLIGLSGGIEEFLSQGEFFLKNFFSDSEQASSLNRQISPQLSKFGLSAEGADANKLFRDFLVGLDTTTEEGARTYATLIKLAPALKQVNDTYQRLAKDRADLEISILSAQGNTAGALARQRALELAEMDASLRPLKERLYALQDEAAAIDKAKSAASALLSTVDASFSVLQKVVSREKADLSTKHDEDVKAIQKRIDAEEVVVGKLKTLSDALHGTADNLKAVGQESASRQLAQAQLLTALTIARAGGPLPAADKLKNTLSVLSQDSSDQYGSYQAYMRDFNTTQNNLNALAKFSDDGLSTAEKTLGILKGQKDALDAAYAEEIKRLDAIVTSAQDQVDELKGQSTTLLSIAQAIRNLAGAISSARMNPVVSSASAITNAYQSALGRAPEAAGMQYWQDRAAAGDPLSGITDAIANSPEAKVQGLYQSLLGRRADSAGMDYWIKSMNQGTSLDEARSAFMRTDEYLKLHPNDTTAGGSVGGGARSFNVAQDVAMASGGSSGNQSTVELQKELAQMKVSFDKIASSTEKTARVLDDVTGGGKYIPTKVLSK